MCALNLACIILSFIPFFTVVFPIPDSRCLFSLVVVLPVVSTATLLADVSLPSLFSNGAVLQREQSIPVWGKADAGEDVTVTLNNKKAEATADASGNWLVNLPALPAGGPFEMKVKGKNEIVVSDIAIGEVWIASGQSNMEFKLGRVGKKPNAHYIQAARVEIKAANDPMLRMFTLKRNLALQPLSNMEAVGGPWQAASPENAGRFTAVGYYFAKELRQKLGVPVGIIHTSWGGSPAEAWMSLPGLKTNAVLAHYIEKREHWINNAPQIEREYKEVTLVKWKAAVTEAKAAGKSGPRRPRAPTGPQSPHLPGNLYNGMLHPLAPYGIRGAIWYQGESNASRGKEYRTLFPAMIRDWRKLWNQGEFPFLFVQLANFQDPQTTPVEKASWPVLREAQMQTLSLRGTGMASAIDLADAENPGDIHPHNKKEVGHRLALNAFALVYNLKVPSYSGPLYSGMTTEGNKVRLNFQHADGGLKAKGDRLAGFAIAGKDGNFVWADASIDDNTVVVSSETVKEPVAVRYGWAMNPIGNLYNGEGLPASPFRTDTEAEE